MARGAVRMQSGEGDIGLARGCRYDRAASLCKAQLARWS